MNTGSRNNEELVKLYKESRDEAYLAELISQNTGLINILVSSYLSSIPNSELEDLVSESYIPMLKAIEDFDEKQGFSFSTLLKAYVRQHLNRLYNRLPERNALQAPRLLAMRAWWRSTKRADQSWIAPLLWSWRILALWSLWTCLDP